MVAPEDGGEREASMTCADLCLMMATELARPKGELIVADSSLLGNGKMDHGTALARVRLAVEFAKRDNGLKLRALVEGWDIARIVREMY
jgi:hypothetical protein